ncbi:MAG: hypothetical protein JJE16_08170 [Nitrospiraceae bacterium]|nr:hypothetical protein [Nitrospiraceae bacterium]
MVQADVELSRGRRGRKLAGQTTKQGRGSRATASKVSVMDDGKAGASHGQGDHAVNGTNHVPVTFWVPDGSCAEGKTHHVGGEVIFIESKRVVPVGTEVTIRLISSNDALVNWGVAKGIVAWQCPAEDQFRNREGFGVCLQGRWPQPPGPTEMSDPKETA